MEESQKITSFGYLKRVLSVLLIIFFSEIIEGKLLVNNNEWRNCIGENELMLSISSFHNKPFEETLKVFEINNTIPPIAIATVDISLCSVEDHPDACSQEHANQFVLPCSLVTEKNKPWTDFINSMEPKWECPLKSGVYRSTAPDSDVWKIFKKYLRETKAGSYQVNFKVTFGLATILCWDMEFEIKEG